MLQKISYNLGIATLSRLIVGGFSLIVVGILTRYLGPSGYGEYSSVFAYLYVFTAIADLGLYTILVREISRNDTKESSIASKIFSFRLVAVVGCIILANLIAFTLPYPIKLKLGIFIASAFSIFSSLAQVVTGIFQKHLRLYLVSISDVIARSMQVAALLVLVHFETGLLWFIGAVALTEIIHFILIFSFSRSLVRVRWSPDMKYWRETFKVALPIAISLVFTLIYFKMDTVLLSIMKPAYDVGVYSVAYKVLEAVIFLPAIYVGLVMPILSKHAVAAKAEFIKTFSKALDVISIFALWFFTYIFLMSDWIIRIIGGRNFVTAGPVLKILSIAIFLIFFGNLGGNAIIALNLQKKAMWIYFLGAIVNVGANVIFIPGYSYFATAWTTVSAELLITGLMFWLIKKEAGAKIHKTTMSKALLAAIATSAIMLSFRSNFGLASLSWLLYFPILFMLGGFTKADIQDIISLKKSLPH